MINLSIFAGDLPSEPAITRQGLTYHETISCGWVN
jgi:hypothetical protein